jgi:Holliday junction resolvase RusA-like endonuclease
MIHKATIAIEPVPASRPRVTRFGTYFPKRYANFRKDLGGILDGYSLTPSDGLLYVKLDFYVQIPKSWSNKKKKESEGKFCWNNADIDNYVKAFLDSAEGRYFKNDRQVVMIRARKFYSNEARIVFESAPVIN